MLADCLIIFAVRMAEKGMKAERELRNINAEKEQAAHEQEKVNKKSIQKMDRDAQKREQSRIKGMNKGSSAAFGKSHTIQQPKKAN